jgi:hypothetical protein
MISQTLRVVQIILAGIDWLVGRLLVVWSSRWLSVFVGSGDRNRTSKGGGENN